MNTLRHKIIAVALLALTTLSAGAYDFAGERLHYQIVYQWGVIWKHAGDATLSMKRAGTGYLATLTGKTRSWADKVYPVRDTLLCTLNSKLQPLKYEKLTHEKDYHARDIVEFSYNYSHTNARCKRIRKSGTQELTLSAKCQAYDMLSVFYMLRTLDFDQMASSKKPHTTVIFSGKEKEYLTITSKGRGKVKLRNGTRHDAYHIVFKFTQKNGTKSSDNIDAWISTDESHKPLLLVGHLPVGQVKCYLAN